MFKKWLIITVTIFLCAQKLIGKPQLTNNCYSSAYLSAIKDSCLSLCNERNHSTLLSRKNIENIKRANINQGLVDPDPEIEQIIKQGLKDFDIDKPVAVLKNKDAKCVPLSSVAYCGKNAGFYYVAYLPFDSILTYRDHNNNMQLEQIVQPYLKKFCLYHELSHIKNGDLDCKQGPATYKLLQGYFGKGLTFLALYALFSQDWKASFPCIFGGLCAWLGGYHYYKNAHFAESRRHESAADEGALKILLQKNDVKPIIHWIIDLKIKQSMRAYNSNSKSNYQSHPTKQERAQAAIQALRGAKIHWTKTFYNDFLKELKGDRFAILRIQYFNKLYSELTSHYREPSNSRLQRRDGKCDNLINFRKKIKSL